MYFWEKYQCHGSLKKVKVRQGIHQKFSGLVCIWSCQTIKIGTDCGRPAEAVDDLLCFTARAELPSREQNIKAEPWNTHNKFWRIQGWGCNGSTSLLYKTKTTWLYKVSEWPKIGHKWTKKILVSSTNFKITSFISQQGFLNKV